jgi:hypothetical protein
VVGVNARGMRDYANHVNSLRVFIEQRIDEWSRFVIFVQVEQLPLDMFSLYDRGCLSLFTEEITPNE